MSTMKFIDLFVPEFFVVAIASHAVQFVAVLTGKVAK